MVKGGVVFVGRAHWQYNTIKAVCLSWLSWLSLCLQFSAGACLFQEIKQLEHSHLVHKELKESLREAVGTEVPEACSSVQRALQEYCTCLMV
jgi:hypothetical protein